jgi:L-threonylcarbamoyladenylate synthase
VKEIEILNSGGIILYPTDTIWGLGCDATNEKAIEKILSLKGREQGKHLLILVSNIAMLGNYVETIPNKALELINSVKEPLTIIYPNAKNLPKILSSDDNTIGIRIPNHSYCQELIQCLGKPIISTSANKSGEPSPNGFKDISKKIKDGVDYIAEIEREKLSFKASSIYKVTLNEEVITIR